MDGEFTETGINRGTCRHVLKGSGTAGQVSAEGQGRGGGRCRENSGQHRPEVNTGKIKSKRIRSVFIHFHLKNGQPFNRDSYHQLLLCVWGLWRDPGRGHGPDRILI